MYKVGSIIAGPLAAYKELLPKFKRYMTKQETFVVIALDAQSRIIGKPWRASLGTVSETTIMPRDLFREAIKRNAVSVLMAHNHPSGNLEPSQDDIALTHKMCEVGRMIGIPVVDHLIITKSQYISLSTRGVI